MQRKYPFSSAFGPSDTRVSCIESAQKVYEKLLLRTPDQEELNFETIALIAKNSDGSLDERKIKELIKIFRPDRKGSLSLLEFVKSGKHSQILLFASPLNNCYFQHHLTEVYYVHEKLSACGPCFT